MWGNQATSEYEPTWNTYKNHTVAGENNDLNEHDSPKNVQKWIFDTDNLTNSLKS